MFLNSKYSLMPTQISRLLLASSSQSSLHLFYMSHQRNLKESSLSNGTCTRDPPIVLGEDRHLCVILASPGCVTPSWYLEVSTQQGDPIFTVTHERQGGMLLQNSFPFQDPVNAQSPCLSPTCSVRTPGQGEENYVSGRVAISCSQLWLVILWVNCQGQFAN